MYVVKNRFADMVKVLATNVDNPLIIRRPYTKRGHIKHVMKKTTKPVEDEMAEADKSILADISLVDQMNMDTHGIVIAHGSYVPGEVTNSSLSSPNSCGSWTPYGDYWGQRSPYTMSTASSPSLAGTPPPPPESHTVFLSGFHHDTTLRQIRTMVEETSCRLGLSDRNIVFVDGSTVVVSNEADAKSLTCALNGYLFQGNYIVARYDRRPYEFSTYAYPQSYPYYGFQNWEQNWERGRGHFWHQYWPQGSGDYWRC
ncbi:hypothetical protein F4679DRAFT_556483 [Xylaria curta]|nr:hypothetical protein F4679DRAFT_556483 [Xylaria curta]